MPFPNLDGRPVEYTDDVPKKVETYIAYCFEAKELPTKAGFAVSIGVSKKTLLNWAEKQDQLLHALAYMDSLQENQVWQKALKGEYNSNIAKLLLANHGYSDKSEVKQEIKAEVDTKPDMDTKTKIDMLMAKLEEQKKLLEENG